MNQNRIIEHPVLGNLENKKTITFTYDQKVLQGYEGDTIASALLANGIRLLRVHEQSGAPRGIYCNIGHCFECRMTVNEMSGVRACLTELKEDMVIESGKIQPLPFSKTTSVDELPRTYAEFTTKCQSHKEEGTHV
ncbi:(2Fe-2S)-binding protein [Bacillus sp. HNG]|nr:(2Fe-2S)-binding protein [Bacillus sp. HNG]